MLLLHMAYSEQMARQGGGHLPPLGFGFPEEAVDQQRGSGGGMTSIRG